MKKFRWLSLFLAAVMILSSLSLGVFAETYTVKSGDKLWQIAQMYGMDYKELAAYNNLKDPNVLFVGQKLTIPVKTSATTVKPVVTVTPVKPAVTTPPVVTAPPVTPVVPVTPPVVEPVKPVGPPAAVGTAQKLTLLATSDLHGRIYAYEYATDEVDADAGLTKAATIIKRERTASPNLLLMDLGDTVQDNSAELFNDLPVHPMIQALNDLKYDLWTLGNHEFNFEKSFLDKNIAAFKGSVISTNIYQKGTDKRYVNGYKIMNMDGVRVAVIGITPPNVPNWEASSPSHFTGLEFNDIIKETEKAVKELEGKYDVLIGAYHLGPQGEHNYSGIEDVAAKFPQFDVIFGGHAHSKYTKEINGVQLIEPGAYGWAVAKAEVNVIKTEKGYDVKAITTKNIETLTEVEDKDLMEKYAFVHKKSIEDANIVVGKVTADYVTKVDYITGKNTVTTMPTIQLEDSALIDLINDVQTYFTKADVSSAAAFKNDMNLLAGDFKKKNAADIYKYTNTLMGINITGKNLKAYMEWSASYYNTYKSGDVTISFDQNVRGYNYDMFSGVKYDIDISQDAGARIKNLTLKGEPIVDSKIYKLAVNNYRFGTLVSLKLATAADVYYDSYIELQDNGRIRDMISVYLKAVKGSKATPSVDNNWKIIGANMNHPLKDQILQMIIDGKVKIPTSADGRTPNVKAVNAYDLIKQGLFPEYKSLTLLHTNDMHGFFIEGSSDGMGAAKLATVVNNMKKANKNVLLLDAGDALQGHSLVTLSKGEEGVKVMNALGYNAMGTGNHEFDYGSAQTQKLAGMLNYPMLAANIKKADGTLLLAPYKIIDVDGVKVGIFGLATPETTYKSHPDNTKGLKFDDIYDTSNQMVSQLLLMGADVVVALAHVGDEGDYTTEKLASTVRGIDVIIDGHSHSTYATGKTVGNTLIVSAGEKTKNLGVVEIALKNNRIAFKGASLSTKLQNAKTEANAQIAALITEIKAKNDVITSEVVATSPFALPGDKPVVRAGEAILGNLLAEALLNISGANVALTNGGGIRTSIDAGPVTKGEVLGVLPFGNTVRVIEVKGSDILAALEVGLDTFPAEKGAFPHFAGMTVKFDAAKPAGKRVHEVKIGGVLLDVNKVYSLATNDFIAAGGDGYVSLKGKKVIAEFGTMDQVLIDYMNKVGFGKAIKDGRIQNVPGPVGYIIDFFMLKNLVRM